MTLLGRLLAEPLRRDRVVVGATLAILGALAWAYTGFLAWQMERIGTSAPPDMAAEMAGMWMAMAAPWSAAQWGLMIVMWFVMMVAMMLPSAAPMILTFARINRSRAAAGEPTAATGLFLAGYLLVWLGFSAAAAAGQFALQTATLATMDMTVTPTLGGALLIAAGLFQFTDLKQACLAKCRTPVGFVIAHWREGHIGAFVMGAHHGGYCLICCWALMALLFVFGVMNLLWIAGLAALVLAEKLLPAGERIAKLTGLPLIGAGIWLLVGG
jgi:predicted metal-binding membrane protein